MRALPLLLVLLAAPAWGQGLLRSTQPTPHPAGFFVAGDNPATGGLGKPDCEVESLANSGATTTRGIQATACCTASNGCNVSMDSLLNAYSTLLSPLDWTQPNSTIDCTTATGEGMAFRDFPFRILTDNVIVKNCRVRGTASGSLDDCWVVSGENVVLDHVSGLWCSDEIIDITNHPSVTNGPVRNITIQYSILAEPSDAFTALATRLTGISDGVEGPLTFFRNVMARSTDRSCWKLAADGADLDVRLIENVCYDFIYGSLGSATGAGFTLNADYLRNVYKRGPSRVGEPVTAVEKLPIMLQDFNSPNAGKVFVYGEGNVLLDNGAPGLGWGDLFTLTGAESDLFTLESTGDPGDWPTATCDTPPCGEHTTTPWLPITTPFGALSAPGETILRQVLSEAGPACLETAEARVLSDVRNGTRSGPFPRTTGDYPTLTGSCQ
jgi:hypothetical protein